MKRRTLLLIILQDLVAKMFQNYVINLFLNFYQKINSNIILKMIKNLKTKIIIIKNSFKINILYKIVLVQSQDYLLMFNSLTMKKENHLAILDQKKFKFRKSSKNEDVKIK